MSVRADSALPSGAACAGYQFAGLQRGNTCYCGDEYGQHGMAEADVAATCLDSAGAAVDPMPEGRTGCAEANGTYSRGSMACGSPCEGNSTAMCGGRGANSIYAMTAEDGDDSRRRDCHLMAPPCTFSRYFNRDKQGVSVK